MKWNNSHAQSIMGNSQGLHLEWGLWKVFSKEMVPSLDGGWKVGKDTSHLENNVNVCYNSLNTNISFYFIKWTFLILT